MCDKIVVDPNGHKKPYLLWFAHGQLSSFKIPEVESLISLFQIKVKWIEKPTEHPFLIVELDSESDAKQLFSRSVLGKSVFELWAAADTSEELHEQLQKLPEEFLAPFCSADKSFKIEVDAFGKKLSRSIKIDKIEELSFLPLKGPVKLDDPDYCFHLLEYYGTDPGSVPDKPYRVFFGRWIADGYRKILKSYDLKHRKFIGNTSMDPLLSFIMANLALIKASDIVLDPFVGSGSLLVAAAHFQAYVLGTDIDFLMLHGRTKPTRVKQKKRDADESILANLRQYNLHSFYLDVLVADAALPLWRDNVRFDAIVTDPPYGIREATERIGTTKDYTIPPHLVSGHIPSKVSYNLQEIVSDLLTFSACHLKLGGRLVYWLPVYKTDFDEQRLPCHPCLKMLSYCEQVLTNHTSRYLITMEKIKEPWSNVSNQFMATVSEATRTFRHKYFQSVKKNNHLEA